MKPFGTQRSALAAVLLLAVAVAIVPSRALADGGGEAGLVIQNGNTIETYCVAFEGDSISGADLLKKANLSVVQFTGLVCAIQQTGCFQPTSVETCVCKSYPPDSTYWAFFTQSYGKGWVYSPLGFALAKAKDGDLQGWKWGVGGPASAPAPAPMTFEQVCGHAPRGGVQPIATTVQPTLAQTQATPTATATAATTTSATPVAPTTITPTAALQTVTPLAAASPIPQEPLTVIAHGTATAVPAASTTGSSNSGGNGKSLIAFGVIAAALAATIGGAVWWRRSHGS